MHNEVRILCVDDEVNVLRSLERMFLDEDYELLTASSATEGLEILGKVGPVQIAISDYRMPGMNGVEFLREVCARWPETVRIVLSGYADTAAIVSAINEGQIYKFVPKPWNEDDLKVTVLNALEKYRLQMYNSELLKELSDSNEELRLINENLERMVEERTKELLLRNRILSAAQNILDILPVGVLGVDTQGTVIQCNEMAARCLRVEQHEVVGNSAAAVLPPEFSALVNDLADRKTELYSVTSIRGARIRGEYLRADKQEGMVFVIDGECVDELNQGA